MRPRLVTGAGLLAVLGVGLAAASLAARDRTFPRSDLSARLMYLQSPVVAKRAFLGFDALAADVYWIRTIQHYGRDRRSSRTVDRFEHLYPLLDLTTTLDPRFNVAYRFGAVFLAMDPPDGPARPDMAVKLLEKGLEANPSRWQYAHDIGFVHYWYTGDYARAASWFERAAGMAGAPAWIRPLAAMTRVQGGDRAGARRLFEELVTSDQAYIRSAAERALAQLAALDAIDQLHALVDRFKNATGRTPTSWDDLIRARLLPGLPADVTRTPFALDPTTGAVTLGPGSSLLPLPRGVALP